MKEAPVKRPPKFRLSQNEYRVWTGNAWSLVKAQAILFDSMDDADEYVKENYDRLIGT